MDRRKFFLAQSRKDNFCAWQFQFALKGKRTFRRSASELENPQNRAKQYLKAARLMKIEISGTIESYEMGEERNADTGYFLKAIAYFPLDLCTSSEERIYFLHKVEKGE